MASIYNTRAAFTSSLQRDTLQHMTSYTYLPLQLLPARTHSNIQVYTLHMPKSGKTATHRARQKGTYVPRDVGACSPPHRALELHAEAQARRGAERLRRDGHPLGRCERRDTGTSDGDLASGLSHRSGKCSNARSLSLVGSHSILPIISNKIKGFLTQESLPLPTRSLPKPLAREVHTTVGRRAAPLRTPYIPPQGQHPPKHQTWSLGISLAHGASEGTGHVRDHGSPARSPCGDPEKVIFPPSPEHEADPSHTFPRPSRG